MKVLEKAYSHAFKRVLKIVNPVKKRIMRAECVVHKFINNQSLIVLKNDGYIDVYKLANLYIKYINAGVVWADQDLKSSNHFYNPNRDKGLYGNSDAKKECISYYTNAIEAYYNHNIKSAMFYLGAACHLIQDLTVPQHANVKLLKNHKSYENWVIKTHEHHSEFKLKKGGIYFNSLEEYIYFNSKESIKTYMKYSHIENKEAKFHVITLKVLTMAEATTAGLIAKFYNDTHKKQISI